MAMTVDQMMSVFYITLNQLSSTVGTNPQFGLGDLLQAMIGAQPGLGQPAVSIANLATGGAIGTAPVTVDNASVFLIDQTTASQTISLPTPTVATIVRTAYLVNVGSVAFTTSSGTTVSAGKSQGQVWTGSAWVDLN